MYSSLDRYARRLCSTEEYWKGFPHLSHFVTRVLLLMHYVTKVAFHLSRLAGQTVLSVNGMGQF